MRKNNKFQNIQIRKFYKIIKYLFLLTAMKIFVQYMLIVTYVFTTTTYIDAANNDVTILTNYNDAIPLNKVCFIIKLFLEENYCHVIHEINISTSFGHKKEQQKLIFYKLLDLFKRNINISCLNLKIAETAIFDVFNEQLTSYKELEALSQLHIVDKTLYELIKFTVALTNISKNHVADQNVYTSNDLPSPLYLSNFFDMIILLYMAEFENEKINFVMHIIKYNMFAKHISLYKNKNLLNYIRQTELLNLRNLDILCLTLETMKISKNLLLVIYFDNIYNLIISVNDDNVDTLMLDESDIVNDSYQAIINEIAEKHCYLSASILSLAPNQKHYLAIYSLLPLIY